MKNVFISFANHDLPLAEFVCRYLRDIFKGKIRFFLSGIMLDPGIDWLKTIKKELDRASAGLFLLTPFSVARPWIYMEFGVVWGRERTVLPVIAGQLELEQVPRPIRDFQIAILENEGSATKLFRQISTICDCSPPRSFDAKEFCSQVRNILTPRDSLAPDCPISSSDPKKLTPELLNPLLVKTEPDNLVWRILYENTLSISAKLDDAGCIIHPFSRSEHFEAIVLHVENSEGIRKSHEGRMVKLVLGDHPVLPAQSQRHLGDSQYVPQQNGFVYYPINAIPLRNPFELKLVFWRMEFNNLLLRIIFVPEIRE